MTTKSVNYHATSDSRGRGTRTVTHRSESCPDLSSFLTEQNNDDDEIEVDRVFGPAADSDAAQFFAHQIPGQQIEEDEEEARSTVRPPYSSSSSSFFLTISLRRLGQ